MNRSKGPQLRHARTRQTAGRRANVPVFIDGPQQRAFDLDPNAAVRALTGELTGALTSDLEQLVSIVMRLLMYLSPVVYTISFVPQEQWGLPLREIYLYNPVACLFALLQWSLLDTPLPPAGPIIALVAFLVASILIGDLIYRRAKIKFTKAF